MNMATAPDQFSSRDGGQSHVPDSCRRGRQNGPEYLILILIPNLTLSLTLPNLTYLSEFWAESVVHGQRREMAEQVVTSY